MAEKKVLIAVGGTGGHIYPALGLANQLSQIEPRPSILLVGGALSKNPFLKEAAFPYQEISCGTISLRKPTSIPSNITKILKGVRQSYRLIQEFTPSLVVGFGSYHSLPTLLAAKWTKTPFVLHEQNSYPGRVNRFLSKYAAFTGICFPSAKSKLKGSCHEVDMPLREGYGFGVMKPQEAKRYFGLDSNDPVVLVFGGSQGARRINQLFQEGVERNNFQNVQLLHFTGDADYTRSLSKHYQTYDIRACVKNFEERMELAWAAADFVVSRAGAGTIAEQIEFEVPGLLIPYPYAMDNHQEFNADYMVLTVGGGVKHLERELTPQKLLQEIVEVFEGGKLLEMKQKLREYKLSKKRDDFCALISDLLAKKER
ncbi:MAG: UDP-N-acetylglucosamine--N-acetylmuramyl-(pentapeptide) pyrophosphoryl-undecaprenol N-acetylglucosamine transferase [Chlamydiae bacterium]|nr:UDP-N-acetylglucosamine--N-acetylmuramyl-(pentapeptide) pyrophosphoryl-undecaprenol N-acetylglucosamine transferase [Chlamydiota bacterium]